MTAAITSGGAIRPAGRWLISKFWQNAHRRLHPPKKTVPDPPEPLMQASSPRCGWKLAIRARRPPRQVPVPVPARAAPHFRGQTRQWSSRRSASPARGASSPASWQSR